MFSQKDAESVASALQKRGILASPYHANMDPADKSHVHRRWSTNKIQVFSSTFGTVYVMGFFKWLRLSFDAHVKVVTPPPNYNWLTKSTISAVNLLASRTRGGELVRLDVQEQYLVREHSR